jgi:hypothetical protein
MAKLISSRTVALATLAAIVVGLATPAFAMTYNRNGKHGELVYVPAESGCTGQPAWCDRAQY